MERSIDVIIPTYRPQRSFELLISRLQRQTVRPSRILVINTGEAYWDEAEFDKSGFIFGSISGIRMELQHITPEEFDHGGTRARAAASSQADYLLYMTQDAVPAERNMIEKLVEAVEADPLIGAAYARQIPKADCGYLEDYTRYFNYGSKSCVKSAQDLEKLGIKTYFCSNVCALYRRNIYLAVGGFPEHTIFNEDMICAARMIQAGYKIAYAADAKVIHSHNYSGAQQFHRNFDLAVSQSNYPEIFDGVKSETEGIRLVKKTAAHLMKTGRFYLLPRLIWQSGCKYLGYRLGKKYRMLPKGIIRKCTASPNYWK